MASYCWAIDGYQGQPATEYALKLLPLVFVRPGELRAAEWADYLDMLRVGAEIIPFRRTAD